MASKSDFRKWADAQHTRKMEALGHIDSSQLTPEEAAQTMAGWELKNPNPSQRYTMSHDEIFGHYFGEFCAHVGDYGQYTRWQASQS